MVGVQFQSPSSLSCSLTIVLLTISLFSFLFSNQRTINVSILALNVGFCCGRVCLTKENTIIHVSAN